MSKGLLIVLSGPSGSGKGTVAGCVLARNPALRLSVSVTTRPARSGEIDGVSYHFLSQGDFEKLIAEDGLLEFARYDSGDYYGTPKAVVEEWLEQGFDVLLEIEVQGYRQVKKCRPDAVGIFLMPPSFEELARRLRARGTETDEKIEQRLKTGICEMRAAKEYGYIVVNHDVGETAGLIESIVAAEKAKSRNMIPMIEEVLAHACP